MLASKRWTWSPGEPAAERTSPSLGLAAGPEGGFGLGQTFSTHSPSRGLHPAFVLLSASGLSVASTARRRIVGAPPSHQSSCAAKHRPGRPNLSVHQRSCCGGIDHLRYWTPICSGVTEASGSSFAGRLGQIAPKPAWSRLPIRAIAAMLSNVASEAPRGPVLAWLRANEEALWPMAWHCARRRRAAYPPAASSAARPPAPARKARPARAWVLLVARRSWPSMAPRLV